MAELLERMARSSRRRVVEARQHESESRLRRRALDRRPPPRLRLDPQGFDLFAEIKHRAPSSGRMRTARMGTDPFPDVKGSVPLSDVALRQAEAYSAAGVAAVSVLTEPDEFAGNLDDLERAARAVPLPVMRKDFLVDPYQILESRARGAAGCLLVLRMLDDARLDQMLDAASEMELFVLLEAFDEQDAERAAGAVGRAARSDPELLVGLNARDLDTLRVDRTRLRRLASSLPPGVPHVAESGLETAADAAEVAARGYEIALVGSALMRSADPATLASRMIAAGRAETWRSCRSVSNSVG